jgi:hypothetical protein
MFLVLPLLSDQAAAARFSLAWDLLLQLSDLKVNHLVGSSQGRPRAIHFLIGGIIILVKDGQALVKKIGVPYLILQIYSLDY